MFVRMIFSMLIVSIALENRRRIFPREDTAIWAHSIAHPDDLHARQAAQSYCKWSPGMSCLVRTSLTVWSPSLWTWLQPNPHSGHADLPPRATWSQQKWSHDVALIHRTLTAICWILAEPLLSCFLFCRSLHSFPHHGVVFLLFLLARRSTSIRFLHACHMPTWSQEKKSMVIVLVPFFPPESWRRRVLVPFFPPESWRRREEWEAASMHPFDRKHEGIFWMMALMILGSGPACLSVHVDAPPFRHPRISLSVYLCLCACNVMCKRICVCLHVCPYLYAIERCSYMFIISVHGDVSCTPHKVSW